MPGCHYQSRTERENDMSRLIDADLMMRKCEKWLKPKAPDVRKKSRFYKILRKHGIIKDYEEDIRTRMEMCERAIKANVCPEDCDICAWDVKGGIDYNGYITTSRNNRKPSEVSKKNQRTDKRRGSSQARHEG